MDGQVLRGGRSLPEDAAIDTGLFLLGHGEGGERRGEGPIQLAFEPVPVGIMPAGSPTIPVDIAELGPVEPEEEFAVFEPPAEIDMVDGVCILFLHIRGGKIDRTRDPLIVRITIKAEINPPTRPSRTGMKPSSKSPRRRSSPAPPHCEKSLCRPPPSPPIGKGITGGTERTSTEKKSPSLGRAIGDDVYHPAQGVLAVKGRKGPLTISIRSIISRGMKLFLL